MSERHAIFINIEIDPAIAADAAIAAKLAEVCPVDIFSATDSTIALVPENLDECVLCNLCVDAAPPGGVKIIKLYE